MSLLVMDPRETSISQGTSGTGVLHWTRELVIRVSGALSIAGTSAYEPQNTPATVQTNSGVASIASDLPPDAAINELRRRSGLTWDQLARLFGVARRSIHFWASGKPMNAANQERLGRLLSVIQYIDRGNAAATRAALTAPLPDGAIPLDRLIQGAFSEVTQHIGRGPSREVPILLPLSGGAKAARMPPSPENLIGALHDPVHQEVGQSRAARSIKTKGNRDGIKR